ncbi:GntR family transcriptional regulator [Micromonospora sp. NPDC049751]|uniref:GntR family transcriptional regulator n=1 Tax=unclassified Micromonospora TaxID=2617518 RepID=UPI0033C2B02A
MPTPHYGQPRYRVIADQLRQRIESGSISPGALLPTESALTVEFRASRGTIRHAIAVLREDGWVTTEHGRGNLAALPPADAEETAEVGAKQRELAAGPELARLFGVDAGEPIIEIEKITRRGSVVVAIVRTYQLRQQIESESSLTDSN